MIVTYDDYLAHHGVKGMKWGVRKDRDKSLSNVRVGTQDPGTVALIAVGAVFVAAHLGLHIANEKDSGKKIAKENANVKWKIDDSLTGKKSVEDLMHQVVEPVNKGYPGKGTKMNCRRCTFAYEMRRRGMDVEATKSRLAAGQGEKGLHEATLGQYLGRSESIWGHKQISNPRAMMKASPADKSKAIFEALGKEPDGSRGELGVGWVVGGGHSMAYEIVNKKPIVFDTQSSVVYRDSQAFEKFGTLVTDAAYTRLDNILMNDDIMRRWAINA